MDGTGPTPGWPRRGGGDRRRRWAAVPDGSDVATAAGGQALDRHGPRAVRSPRHPGQQRGHHPLGRLPRRRHGQPHQPPRRPRLRVVQHGPRRWPHMVEQGYGRIVMTTSTGIFGLPENLSYAAAKGAVIGLTRSLTVAGAAHGIKVNLIAPAAFTRMAGQPADGVDPTRRRLDADGAGAGGTDGRLPRARGLPGERRDLRRRGRTVRPHLHRHHAGVRPPDGDADDRGRRRALGDDQRRERATTVPTDLMAWSAAFTAHLRPPR